MHVYSSAAATLIDSQIANGASSERSTVMTEWRHALPSGARSRVHGHVWPSRRCQQTQRVSRRERAFIRSHYFIMITQLDG